MNKEFIPYEQALELKELGFDEYCFAVWNKPKEDWIFTLVYSSGLLHERYKNDIDGIDRFKVTAPIYQQAFRWFRENKNIECSISRYRDIEGGVYFRYHIEYYSSVYEKHYHKDGFFDYEEAELACLIKLIEIAKYI